MNTDNGALSFDAYINNTEFKRQIDEMNAKISGLSNNAVSESKKMDSAFKNIGGMVAGYFGVEALIGFSRELVNVTGTFQKYEAVLTNTFGSNEKAVQSMEMLTDIAAKTPFQLDAITESYVKLVNQGFEPTREQIVSLGDLASSTGKGFDQLVEAIIDAQTGEFERLKEFGIKASVEGDKVTMSFKGQKVAIDNNAESIRNYILSLGNMKGVAGSMEAISQTIEGQISNLKDSFSQMLNEIGQDNEGFISDIIGGASFVIENYKTILDIIIPLVESYGAYKAALLATAAIQRAKDVYAYASAFLETAKALGVAKAAQTAMNASALANPYIAAAAAILALTAIIYKLATASTKAETAQKELYSSLEAETVTLDVMFERLKNATKGTDEYADAKQAIIDKYGEYDEMLNTELETIEGQKIAYDKLTEAVTKATKAKLRQQYTDEAAKEAADEMADQWKGIRERFIDQLGQEAGTTLFKSVKSAFENGGDYEALIRKAGMSTSEFYGVFGHQLATNFKEIRNQQNILKDQIKEYDDIFGTSTENIKQNNKGGDLAKVVINAEYWEKEVKAAKDALDKLDTKSANFGKSQKDLLDKIAKGEAEINRIRGKKEKGKEKSPEKTYEDTLSQVKAYYDSYTAAVSTGQTNVAEQLKGKLPKGFETYFDYIKDQVNKAVSKNDVKKLLVLTPIYEQLQAEINKELEEKFKAFKENISKIKGETKSTFEYIQKLNFLKSTTKDSTLLSPEERKKYEAEIDKQILNEKKDYMDDLYKTYEDSKEKLEKLQKTYNEDIIILEEQLSKATTDEERKRIKATIKARTDAYYEDMANMIEQSDEWKQYFGDISKLSLSTLDDTVKSLQLMIKTAYEKGKITKEMYMQMMDDVDKRTKESFEGRGFELMFGSGSKGAGISNFIFGEGDFTSKMDTMKDSFSATSDSSGKISGDMSTAGNKAQKVLTIVEAIVNAVHKSLQSLTKVFSAISEYQESLGDDDTAKKYKEIAENMQLVNDAAKGSFDSFKNGDAIGSITNIITAVIQLMTILNKRHDEKIEEDILAQEDAVRSLERAYNDLEKAVNRALGSDVYNKSLQQIKNLKDQQQAYKQMIASESSKKDADQEKISQYKNNFQDINSEINEFVISMREDILGGSAKDLANQLGDSIISAFAAGENAAEAWGKKVDDIVGDIVKKMLIQKIIEEPVGNIINKYASQWVDNEGNFAGFDTVMIGASQMDAELTALSGSISSVLSSMPDTLKNYLGETPDSKTAKTLSGSIQASITEETGTLVAGYMNAMRINQAQSVDIMRNMLAELTVISGNTGYLSLLVSMEKSLSKLSVDTLRANGIN